jgi:putative membrane protein
MSPRSSRSARDAATAPAPLSPHGTFYDVESGLLPALNPPEWGMFDIFPFSLLVKYRTRKGIEMKGKKAARMRAKLRSETVSHNIPLEISLYLSSYVAALQQRKALDPATASELSLSCQIGSQRLIIDHQYCTAALMNAMVQLVDALTGLERILTTPIPFSYSVHLWVVVNIYCLLLPFQIWKPLGWLTIPATAIISFIFFGFLVAGEEIESKFPFNSCLSL